MHKEILSENQCRLLPSVEYLVPAVSDDVIRKFLIDLATDIKLD
jgi:hypothetical protein